jgi:hypothetical protein
MEKFLIHFCLVYLNQEGDQTDVPIHFSFEIEKL